MSGLKVGKAFLQFLSYKSKEQIMQILEVDFYEPMGMEVSQSVWTTLPTLTELKMN